MSAVLTGMGAAFPADVPQDALWDGFFATHFGGSRVARRVFASAGVRQRHTVADPRVEDLSRWSTGARMERYAVEAMPLGKDAVARALDDAGLAPRDVGLFTVVSCTGYATPGVDIRLARDLGMSDSVQRLFVGHMGCYAALPALGAAADFVAARGRPAVVLCLELTSLHVQPPTDDLGQVVAHALFSDAAAAVVLEPAGTGLVVVDVAARTDVGTADHMTWDVTDLGFRMGLSPRVPDVLAVHVAPMVADLLARNGVAPGEVAGWAVHPGGPRILEVVADRLALPAGALDASRAVLAEHGNCSSATVLMVLSALPRPAPGRYVVALAFGPGLTLYAALLRSP
ncbi:MAG: chalcone and stilbene synthase domain protein [Cryptosporangiaceae bacterium]|jgi:alkylresorcinol/alkylpyrone synthase|nr:chalcone and stilbene synthase domain protein [Cryptosporangiaceae bacterium]